MHTNVLGLSHIFTRSEFVIEILNLKTCLFIQILTNSKYATSGQPKDYLKERLTLVIYAPDTTELLNSFLVPQITPNQLMSGQ